MAKYDYEQFTQEIATRDTAQLSSIIGMLPDPDPVLKKLAYGGAKILEDLTADGHLTSAITTRQGATMAREYHWQPGKLENSEASAKAIQVVKWFTEDLERIDMDSLKGQILNAPLYGYTPIELIWERVPGRLRLKELRALPPGWFAYNNKSEPRFRHKDNPWEGVPLSFGKFVFARHGATYDNPYGLRLLSRCFWPVTFKRGGIKFWMLFAEKYGSPFFVGKYAPGASEAEQHKMLASLNAMVQTAVAVIPQGGAIEILANGARSGADSIHEKIKTAMDAEISKVISGQTLTSEVGSSGSYAAAKTHADILEVLQDSDAKLFKTTLEEIAWIYTELNAPGAISPVLEWQEDEDLQPKRTERDKDLSQVLKQSGYKFSKKYLMTNYKLEDDDIEEAPAPQVPTPYYPQFSERQSQAQNNAQRPALKGQADLDQLIEMLIAEAGDTLTGSENRLMDIIESASSFEEMQAKILEAYSGLDSGKLEELLSKGMTSAALLGKLTVYQESQEDGK